MNKEFIKAFIGRIISSVITLFLLISFIYILIRLSPGDPSQKFLSAKFSPELAQKVTSSFHLDRPILEQYFSFVTNIFTGDFGFSYNDKLPVLSVVWQYLSFTLVFASISFIIQIIFSFYLALKSMSNAGKQSDKIITKLSLLIYATPAFVLGVFLIYLFSVQLDLFPSSGLKSLDFDSFSLMGKLGDYFLHLTLPLITLSAAGIALFYKYLRDNLEEVYQQDFILFLRSSGTDEKTILKKHVIPNALRPLISIAGIEFGILLGGTLITEVIFGLPGMGRLTIDSITSRDYPLVIGCTFTAGALMILSNIVADLVKMKIDKRLIKGLMN
ncbi:glutathione transport system permease protein GsiC [bacterium BMS3Abin03]|nr:glutathione transport system permease protein GsiC [bacterium BMS3Abin03]